MDGKESNEVRKCMGTSGGVCARSRLGQGSTETTGCERDPYIMPDTPMRYSCPTALLGQNVAGIYTHTHAPLTVVV